MSVFVYDDNSEEKTIVTKDGKKILIRRIVSTSQDGCTLVVERSDGTILSVKVC